MFKTLSIISLASAAKISKGKHALTKLTTEVHQLSPLCDIDESQNARGGNRCWSSDECYGSRTCSTHGWCGGEETICSPEPTTPAVNPLCLIDESENARGGNRCWSSDECYGSRSCSSYGWCGGEETICSPAPATPAVCVDGPGRDAFGDGCEWYNLNTWGCGAYNTDNFKSDVQCCGCK